MNKQIRRIGITYNLRREHSGGDCDEEYDEIETIEFLQRQIEKMGYTAVRLEQDETVFARLRSEKPEFVLNIAEGRGKTRGRESQIPCLLEWLQIPYFGSDAIALGIALDKYLANVMLKHAGVPVPDMVMAAGPADLKRQAAGFDGRRFIVKPRWEGSSKGIFSDSVAADYSAIEKKTAFIREQYGQPALIEEFLPGDEVTVGVYGNAEPMIVGMMRISPRHTANAFFVYSLEHKRAWQEKIKYEKAEEILPRETTQMIKAFAQAAFRALELKDIARIDFRLDAAGVPKIIDINPLPGLSPNYSDLMLMCGLHRRDFSVFVQELLALSLARCGCARS
ncbi:MAG: ATP-grasp domain-containing protein [Candidatus Omnitrophica bacterium]|nr:ATP-grasp domain-containing protein [Candidatus Omnitrophota bacterium]